MTTVDNAARVPGGASQGLLARHPIIFYSIIAYAGTWLVWLPLMLSKDGLGILSYSSPLPLILTGGIGTFSGPFLAAFVMTGVTEGREGVSRLLRSIVLWRVGLRWYLFVLLGIPLVLTLGALVVPGTRGSFEPMPPCPC